MSKDDRFHFTIFVVIVAFPCIFIYLSVINNQRTLSLKEETKNLKETLILIERNILKEIREIESKQNLKITKVRNNFIENDETIHENINTIKKSLSSSVKQNLDNALELEKRIQQVVKALNKIKRKTDLINVQGNIDISIIEPSSNKVKIRLKPNN